LSPPEIIEKFDHGKITGICITWLFFISFPHRFHFYPSAITAQFIHPQIEPVEMGQLFYMPSDKAVKTCVRLVEDAHPDTVCAVPAIFYPETKAFFRVDIPFVDPVVIG
jgi:hypothetical protein